MSHDHYSREGYEQAREAASNEEEANRDIAQRIVRKEGSRSLIEEFLGTKGLIALAKSDRAERRLEALYEAGHAEAAQLNRRFDTLRKRAVEAVSELARFESDELGISPERDE